MANLSLASVSLASVSIKQPLPHRYGRPVRANINIAEFSSKTWGNLTHCPNFQSKTQQYSHNYLLLGFHPPSQSAAADHRPSYLNCKIIGRFSIENHHFSIENHHFSGAILRHLYIFNRRFQDRWHLYCYRRPTSPAACFLL